MVKTTVYLPEELKAALERTAKANGRSEAELIREGVRRVTGDRKPRRRPRVPLFSSGAANAREVDKMLGGDASTPALGEW